VTELVEVTGHVNTPSSKRQLAIAISTTFTKCLQINLYLNSLIISGVPF